MRLLIEIVARAWPVLDAEDLGLVDAVLMRFTASRAQRNCPVRFTSMTFCHCASDSGNPRISRFAPRWMTSGAFVGFVLGALIGNLFGKKKPRTPTASAETVLQIPYAQYQLGTITVANNGNRNLVTSMATTARDTLNCLIGMVAYTNTTAYVSNLNGVGTTQIYGHNGNQIYVKINGVQNNFASADQAVEYGTLTAIRNTKIVGGDIFAKRVIARSPAADLTSLTGDLQIASDSSNRAAR